MTPRSPAELVACARECRGLERRALLRTCYGVDFPEETFVALDLDPDKATSNLLPWVLVRPDFAPSPAWLELWERVFAHDPLLVPLDRKWDDFLCYRLDELAVGRTTVFSVDDHELGPQPTERVGESYLAVHHARAVNAAAHAEAEWRSPYNQGAGSIDREEVDWRHSVVAQHETLLRELEQRMIVARTV